MNIYKAIIITVLVLMICIPVYGQSMEKIGLDRAIELAIENSEDYKTADNEVLKRKQQYKQAKSGIYPQVEADLTWTDNFEYPVIASPTVQDYGFDAGVSLSQLLWSFGKVSSAIEFADKYIDIGRLEKDSAKKQVIYIAKIRYYSALMTNNLYDILEQSLENAYKNKSILEDISSNGRVSRRDLIKVDADIASRVPLVGQARAAKESAFRSLKVLTGLAETGTIELTDGYSRDYEELNRENYILKMKSAEPRLQALRKGVEAQDDIVSIKRASYYPTVTAFAGWDEKGVSDDADLYDGGVDGYGVAGIKVNIPLWTSGKTSSELAQAKLDKRNAALALKKTEKDFSLELSNAISEYKEYLTTLEANRKAVELAEKSFNVTQDMFKTGQISAADLNDAELLFTNQKIEEQKTLYNINITLARIELLAAD